MGENRQIYVRNINDAEARGPFSMEQLESLASIGRISVNETYFYDETVEQWLQIGSSDELRTALWPAKKQFGFKRKEFEMLNGETSGTVEPFTVEEHITAAKGNTIAPFTVEEHITAARGSAASSIKAKDTERTCFFAYPFREKFHHLRDELAGLLCQKWGVRLKSTSLEQRDHQVVEDIKRQIFSAHFGIADITGNNPNVLVELGMMMGCGMPFIILKDMADQKKTPFDVYGTYRVEYKIVKSDATGFIEYALLERGLDTSMKFILERNSELRNTPGFWVPNPGDSRRL
jgi:hypothetical protein